MIEPVNDMVSKTTGMPKSPELGGAQSAPRPKVDANNMPRPERPEPPHDKGRNPNYPVKGPTNG